MVRCINMVVYIAFWPMLLVGFTAMQSLAQVPGSDAPAQSKSDLNSKAKEVEKALSAGDELRLAASYELLAKSWMEKKEWAKAEEQLRKAQEIYKRRKNKDKLAEVTRLLARVQEQQSKKREAIENYQSAEKASTNSSMQKLNRNDAKRLKYNDNPVAQKEYLDSNIQISEDAGIKEEVIYNYRQKAEVEEKSNNFGKAADNLAKASEAAGASPVAAELDMELVGNLAKERKFEKAISLAEENLRKTEELKLTDVNLAQKQQLAELYQQSNKTSMALQMLKETYQDAFKYGKTIAARNAVAALAKLYYEGNKPDEARKIFEVYLKDLDTFLARDTSLIDVKQYQLTEQRISQLEKEKKLQTALIKRTNNFNFVLLGSLFLLVMLLAVIFYAYRKNKEKAKKIALQSLRREMNPHFIFNSLNSVNQFIARNDEREANTFLSSYSALMRNVMESSNKDFVKLSQELEQLSQYLKLEHLRFAEHFDYLIKVDNNIDTDGTWVPNMILQPFVENAIWHGLRYKKEKGLLKLHIRLIENKVQVEITDNGIGIEQSKAMKTENQKSYQSRGMSNVIERIHLLNNLYQSDITALVESNPMESGTRVLVSFNPLKVNKAVYG